MSLENKNFGFLMCFILQFSSTPSSSSETNGSLDNGTQVNTNFLILKTSLKTWLLHNFIFHRQVSVNGNIGNILESNEELCDAKEDMVAKLLRHRKILMENCEEAEVEIKRVDDIYHDLVKHVVKASHCFIECLHCY